MPENYRDEEFYEPYKILKKKGYQVDVAGFKPGEAIGANGYKHTPNLLIDDLTNEDFDSYDALVIPGGPASTDYLWNNDLMQSIVKYFHKKNKIVATICYACIVPVQADILQNKNATVYPTEEAKKIFEKHNVNFSPEGCVVLDTEKIITAQGPAFAKEFGQSIAELLEK